MHNSVNGLGFSRAGLKRKMPTIPIKAGRRHLRVGGIMDAGSGCSLIWGDLVKVHRRLPGEKAESERVHGERKLPNGR